MNKPNNETNPGNAGQKGANQPGQQGGQHGGQKGGQQGGQSGTQRPGSSTETTKPSQGESRPSSNEPRRDAPAAGKSPQYDDRPGQHRETNPTTGNQPGGTDQPTPGTPNFGDKESGDPRKLDVEAGKTNTSRERK